MPLLTINAGNSNTVFGLFEEKKLKKIWRVPSVPQEVVRLQNKLPRGLSGVIISSVVPTLNPTLAQISRRVCGKNPIFVRPDMKLPIRVRVKNPEKVGQDRIVNAVAAYTRWKTEKKALIVIDLGTATTFDAVTKDGDFIGGAILAGMGTANDALVERCALLPHVPLKKPKRAIGRTTVEAIQSGVFLGYVGLVEGLIARFQKELGSSKVIATGGLGSMIAKATKFIHVTEPHLTLEGLRLIYEWSQPRRHPRKSR